MSTTEQAAEIERLRIENESLKAQLIAAKGSPATKRSDPRNWAIARQAMRAIVLEDAARDGFDARTPEGHQAWWNWRYPDLARAVEEARANGRLPAAPGGKMMSTGLTSFAEPGPDTFESITGQVATPAGIARAAAIASGAVTPLPSNPLARAIIAADRKAREPGDRS